MLLIVCFHVSRNFAFPGTELEGLPPAQAQALVDFYNAAGGPSWSVSTNWLVGDPCAEAWSGVICDAANASVTYVLKLEKSFSSVARMRLLYSF